MMKFGTRLWATVLAAGTIALGAANANADSVTITGEHTVPDDNISSNGNYRPYVIVTSRLFTFDEIQQGIHVTGSVTLDLPGNSTAFIGLISADVYEQWLNETAHDPNDSQTDYFGFGYTAWVGFNTGGGGRIGLGQYKQIGGEMLQTYAGNGIGTDFENFSVVFDATTMTLIFNGNEVSQPYGDIVNYLYYEGVDNQTTIPTDWTNGAYLFAGAWFDKAGGTVTYDVTAEVMGQVVPLPAAAWAGITLLGGLGGVRVWRRRRIA